MHMIKTHQITQINNKYKLSIHMYFTFRKLNRYQLEKKKEELTLKIWKRDGIEIFKSFTLLDNFPWLNLV